MSSPKKSPIKSSPIKNKDPITKRLMDNLNIGFKKAFTIKNILKTIVIGLYVITSYLNFEQYTMLLELESQGINIADRDSNRDIPEIQKVRDQMIYYTITELSLIALRVILTFGGNFSINMTMALLAVIKWLILTTDSPIVESLADIITLISRISGNDTITRGHAVRQITLINGMLSIFGAIFTLIPISRIIVNISLAILSANLILSQLNVF